ncbi:MAG: UDP-N-acetylmuramoyl-tripeptide--D-alanyl-D-alanine ligase [Desulforegulaceae bacterium]|nr:UDP-N-acetylmuramoyl-tripeptide--D-alanyl-D-alanine ligase [Desulforegulaceae bacterium]
MGTKDFIIKNLDTLALACEGKIIKRGSLSFSGKLLTDSRRLSDNSFFIAIKGDKFNGHDFVLKAVNQNISGVIIENSEIKLAENINQASVISVENSIKALGKVANFKRKKSGIKVFGITGSVGKTSTREILKSILSQKFQVHGPAKNFNNHIGVPLTILEINKNHEFAVIEMGMSSKGEIEYLSKIAEPNFAIITKLAPAHIEFFENFEEIAREKATITKGMKKNSFIIINEDDEILEKHIKNMKILKFGFNEKSNLFISDFEIGNSSSKALFNLNFSGKKESFQVNLNIPGKTMLKNAAGAALAGFISGMNSKEIAKGIAMYSGTKGRFFKIHDPGKNIFIIDDTYNANPESLKASAKDFTLIKNGSRGFAVIGDMLELGKQSKDYHFKAGETLGELELDGIFVYGDFADSLIAGAKNKTSKKTILYKGNHKQISDELLKTIKPGDFILVKGSRGSKMETIIENLTNKTE